MLQYSTHLQGLLLHLTITEGRDCSWRRKIGDCPIVSLLCLYCECIDWFHIAARLHAYLTCCLCVDGLTSMYLLTIIGFPLQLYQVQIMEIHQTTLASHKSSCDHITLKTSKH